MALFLTSIVTGYFTFAPIDGEEYSLWKTIVNFREVEQSLILREIREEGRNGKAEKRGTGNFV